jgi:RNA exonuclease 4
MMGGPYNGNESDRVGLSKSNHDHTRTGNLSRHSSLQRTHKHGSFANSALNSGSNHSPPNSNGLNGSSHHSRNTFRNKSFTKPRINTNNPVYDPLSGNSNHSTRSTGSFLHSYKKPDLPQKSQYLAMDCEMVGTITGESVAARVVLIDWRGRTVLDIYVKPDVEIADYRTFVSGITKEHLDDAHTYADAQKQVRDLLIDKILVGHGVDNDLRALGLVHPWLMTRDTAYYQPFMRVLETSTNNVSAITSRDGKNSPVWGPRKLKELAKEKLQREIQVVGGSHCPVEDALAALDLYKSHRPRWEACMSSEERQQQQYALQMAAARYAYDYESSMLSSSSSSSSYISTLTPPTSSKFHASSLSRNELSMSMHSYSTYENQLDGCSIHSVQLDNSMHGRSFHGEPLRSLSNGYNSLSTLHGGQSYHQESSLDCRTYHGPYPSRPQFHRSASLEECPIHFASPVSTPDIVLNRKVFQRQSSLEYAPPGILQRQSSLEYAPPGLPSQSKFAFAREVTPPPPGFE